MEQQSGVKLTKWGKPDRRAGENISRSASRTFREQARLNDWPYVSRRTKTIVAKTTELIARFHWMNPRANRYKL